MGRNPTIYPLAKSIMTISTSRGRFGVGHLLLPVLLVLVQPCMAFTSFLVEAGSSKCFFVESAMDTVIRVDYQAPDLPENDVTNPAYLEIHTQPRNRAMWTDLHEAPVREHLTPTREILEHTNPTEIDTVFHRMEMDGVANICFRAPRKGGGHANHNARDHHDSNGADADAGTMAIYRFSARVEQSEERRPPVITDGRVINDYLTFMEQEMDRIEVSLANVIREADFAQRKDSDMHKQFEEMYATTFYWPLLHVIILLLTGYTQASHIVHFFRTRRII